MIYTEQTKKALKLCFEIHKDQTDRGGLPYVFHPFHLAEQMTDEASTIVALLHDVAENSSVTLDDIREMGFPHEVTEALTLLYHEKSVPYMDYVVKLGENQIARIVKLAELKHNSDMSRLDELTADDWKRTMEYLQAFDLLDDWQEFHIRPAWRLSCCGTVVPAWRRYCPSCGKPIQTPQEEITADFDTEATMWGCTCGNYEEYRFQFCSRCGRKRWQDA